MAHCWEFNYRQFVFYLPNVFLFISFYYFFLLQGRISFPFIWAIHQFLLNTTGSVSAQNEIRQQRSSHSLGGTVVAMGSGCSVIMLEMIWIMTQSSR